MPCTPVLRNVGRLKSVACSIESPQLSKKAHRFPHSWIVSDASDVHVCNDRNRLLDSNDVREEALYGDMRVQVKGYGRAWLRISKGGPIYKRVILSDVAFIPDFPTNILAVKRLPRCPSK